MQPKYVWFKFSKLIVYYLTNFLRIILPDVYQKIRMIGGDQFDEWCQSVFFLDQFSISLRKIKFEVCM